MYPTFELPGLHVVIPASAASLWITILFCLWAGPRWGEKLFGLERGRCRTALIVLIVVTLVGARAHFVLTHAAYYRDHVAAAFRLWSGDSYHAPGGILLMALCLPPIVRTLGIPVGRLADVVGLTLGPALALMRVGCFLQGCCYGAVCTKPWCIPFPSGSQAYQAHLALHVVPLGAPHSAPVHPLQLYFMMAALGVFAAARWLCGRRQYDGQVVLVALLLFSASSAMLEFLRADYIGRAYWGPLPQIEWTLLAMTAGVLGVLIVAHARHRRRPAAYARAASAA